MQAYELEPMSGNYFLRKNERQTYNCGCKEFKGSTILESSFMELEALVTFFEFFFATTKCSENG